MFQQRQQPIKNEVLTFTRDLTPSSQVDLLLDRADGIINLCEMKWSSGVYAITADDDLSMRNKKSEFKEETATRKSVHVTYVTSYGVKPNAYAKNIQSFVTLNDLFRP